MFDLLKSGFLFIKKNPTILFSLVLIILLPIILYLNTFLTLQSLQEAIDKNLQTQAININNILGKLIARDFPAAGQANIAMLQKTIDELAGNIAANNYQAQNVNNTQSNIKLENIRVIIKENSNFKIIAAQNADEINQTIDLTPSLNGEEVIAIAWAQNNDAMSPVEINNDQYWRIIKVLTDKIITKPMD